MRKIIRRKSYDTETAILLSYNGILNWDGRTRINNLYKTKKGNYFMHFETTWQDESDDIEPIDIEGAMDFHEQALNIEVEFETAFPDFEIEEA